MSNNEHTNREGIIGNSKISVGRFTYGYDNVQIHTLFEGAPLNIGSFCSLAPNITILLGMNHRTDWLTTFPFGHVFKEHLGNSDIEGHPTTRGAVNIGHDVWIGRGSTIMSGVSIGNGAVIAANSHVVKDVAPYSIVGGNPARHIRFRFDQANIDFLLNLKWWDFPTETIKSIAPLLCAAPSDNNLFALQQVAAMLSPANNSEAAQDR